jgi:hypothetical protein
MSFTHEQRIDRRNIKVQTIFSDLAPVWLLNDTYHSEKDSFIFNMVYRNSVHGWINQRMRYDSFNDVLYRLGETNLPEADVLQLEGQSPYISGNGEASIPNNPGNRL